MIVDASCHNLSSNVTARRRADPNQRIMTASKNWIDGGNSVDAITDEKITAAYGSVLGSTAVQDLGYTKGSLVNVFLDRERSPHRDVFFTSRDSVNRLIKVKVDARFGTKIPDVNDKRLG